MIRKKTKSKSLTAISFRNNLIVSISIGFTVAAIFIFFEVREFNKDAEKAREEGLESKKELVKAEVEKVIDYIHFTRLFMEKRMRNNLKERTYEAWSIINNIYNKNHETHTKREILHLIKQALRPVRFNNGRGYYFLVNLNGVEELYPVRPEFEGENLIDLQDARGNYVIKDEIKIAKEQGEGFVKGYWRKPYADSTKMFAKTSFIKVFKPLGIYVGCGDYLIDVRKDIQDDIKMRIKRTRFGEYGYVFVNTYTGVAVVIDSKKYSEGDTIWELTDPYGVKVIQEEWKAVNKPGGGFIRYHWLKPGTDKIAPKISFIKGVDEWQWMIGAGVYIDVIEENIARERELLYKRMIRKGGLGLLLILIVLVLIFYMAQRNARIIHSNLETFISKLRIAVKSGKKMNADDYSLVDLQNILPPINEIIEHKKEAEAQLKESEIRFRTIFENLPVMLLVFDNDLNIKFCNKEFNREFNIKSHKKIEKRALLRYLPNNKTNKDFISALPKCDGNFREINIKTSQGDKWHNWACFNTPGGETILAGFDITPIYQNQKHLAESNATKDKILSVVSHDLHGPFNTIIGFSNILLSNEEKLNADKRRRYLQHIHNSSKSMHTMLTNLLSWARAQSGKIKLYFTVVELYLLTSEIVKILSPLAAQKNIKLINEIEAGLTLHSDTSLLRIIIQNLVANGIKFTEPGGKVEVSARWSDDNTIKLIVIDSGIGMPSAMVEKINSGQRVESSPGTNKESGTGLGLLICQEFITYLDGTLKVKSHPNEGSSFVVSLPAHKQLRQKL